MKLATQILLFGQEKWIMQTLENAYENVDHIYIAYSKMPWTYNEKARKLIEIVLI
jgi:mRNA deadenylase 3'-5' endonuclease subunit Ccr4